MEKIELTDAEVRAVGNLVYLEPHPADGRARDAAIRRVINLINEVREGDPVATVRYHFELDRFYRRENDSLGEHRWAVYRRGADYLNALPANTDLIYRPEVP